ncbi:sugar phosphate isomerase/epimerase family protein [Enterococcus massiliensis]|uniref:sugar phosphate isomerase/epimerase family protein n=1 Tax=Enterococcus massiliensis TaxID=1640685 RepID=UPI00065E7912|nr:sugar phosphate isomerase/epimerase [Enterococcus massiliensis]
MKPKIALQLWSVKEACEADFYGTLKQLKEAGYDGVEFAGYHGKTAEEIKNWLTELKLEVAASHISFEELKNDLPAVIAFEKMIGNSQVVCPWLHFETFEDWQQAACDLQQIDTKLKEAGLHFAYHNHAHEFSEIPDTDILDYLSQTVKLEVDLYWLAYAGIDVAAWLRQHQSKIALLHIKDMQREPKESTEIGRGVLPIKAYLEFAKVQAMPWLIIEQEAFQKFSPMEAAVMNQHNLKKIIEEVF